MGGRYRLLALLGVPVVLAGAALGFMATHARSGVTSPPARLEGTDVWGSQARPVGAFQLRDQQGRLFSPRRLRGKVWAVTFLDSHCTKLCPVDARELARTQDLLGRRYLWKIMIISVLPGYDTPTRVRAFVRKTGLHGDWHWLFGTKQTLVPVWQRYGIAVQTGLEHTAALYLVDQRGNVRVADAVPFRPRQLASSVRALDSGRAGKS